MNDSESRGEPRDDYSYEGIGQPSTADASDRPRPRFPTVPSPSRTRRFMAWLGSWRRMWKLPNLDKDAWVREAEQWVNDYTPMNKPELYSVALKYAEQRYEQATQAYESMDKKADDLMRTAGTLSAVLVTLAKLFEMTRPITIVPAVICLVASVILAARVRWPMDFRTPMDTQNLMLVVDNPNVTDKHVVEAVAAASYHAATVGLLVLIRWKATLLERSAGMFCVGLVLLALIPIFGR